MELEDLTESIDRLVKSDPACYADCESIEALQRQLTRLHGFVTAATGAFDSSGNWAPDGARNAASWLATACRMAKGHARAQVRRARALRHLPVCAQAWLDGDLGASHLDVLWAVRREATADALSRDEELLVAQGRRLRHEGFVRAVAYWDQLADPDGAEDRDEARRARRDVYLEASFQGMWLGKITLDPISGAIVSGELERLERELFEADWAEARARLGRRPQASANWPAARASAGPTPSWRWPPAAAWPLRQVRRPAPLFSVLVDYETLQGRICELARRHRARPRVAAQMAGPRRLSSGRCSGPGPACRGQRHRTAVHRCHPPGH